MSAVDIKGTVAPGFEAVADAFAGNFADGLEIGAACAVHLDGRLVVDIWAGMADPGADEPWREDTVAGVFSASKGVAAMCAAVLAQRGKVDLDRPVADYWPEFATGGKERVTVRTLLNHEAGLPAFDRLLTQDEIMARDPVVEALAEQTPFWEPGSTHGYHALTFGWLVGELVRRVDGRRLGDFLAEEVAAPLGADVWIGFPAEEHGRLARLIPAPPPQPTGKPPAVDPAMLEMVAAMGAAMADPQSMTSRAFTLNGAMVDDQAGPEAPRDVEAEKRYYGTEMASVNGVMNARGLARLYAACVGEVAGVRLLQGDLVDEVLQSTVTGKDAVLFATTSIGLGFWRPTGASPMFGPASFGHPGMGGSIGLADPDAGLGFGYVMNKLNTTGMLGEPRKRRLLDALAGCLA